MTGVELHDAGTSDLLVPTFDDDVDALTAALAYAKGGWYVGPAARGLKHPGSVLGDRWQSKTSRDPEQIVAWFAGTNYSVFLHAGRSGAVVLDVDHPDKLSDVLVEAITTACPPFQSTRVAEQGRGHHVFAQPVGRMIGNSTGQLGKGWGEIRGRNGVIMVAPSRHENTAEGGQYTWLQTGRVPVLPQAVAELLPDSEEAAETATDAEVRAFCETYTERRAPSLLLAVLHGYRNDLDKGAARHDSMITAACWAAREARVGAYPALEAFQQLQAAFVKSLEAPRTGSGRTATRAMAKGEFKGIAAWAVAQANTADLADVRRRIKQLHPDFDVPPLTGEPEWSEPVPLDPPRSPAPFPVDALPDWAAAYVAALAEATQTPADLAGCCVLGVLAACAGGRAVVEARRGWREPTNLYLLPVLRPGSRKSAVISAVTKPLYEVEKTLWERAHAEIAETATLRDIAVKAAEKATRDAANAKPDNRDALTANAVSAANQAAALQVPTVPRLIADDVTPEAAASLLAEHDGRMAIISAEGGLFDIIAGKYNNGVPSLDVWLKGHAGDQLRIDRKGRGSEYVAHPALTMLLTVQPAVLSTIAGNGAFRGRGLLARFLYSIPESNLGHRRIGADPVPDEVTDTYNKHVHQLATDLAGWTDPAVLTLSTQACKLLLDTERRIEPQLTDDGDLGGSITEWGSKLVGAMLRIAGLLHLATEHEAFRTPIHRDNLAAAIRIGDYFAEHARAAFYLLSDPSSRDAAYLLDHLVKKDATEFTIRSLLTDLPRGRFATAEDVTAAVTVLEEHGYVRPQKQPERPGPGRKPSRGYLVHPDIAAESAQSAECSDDNRAGRVR